jgi:hypothetical protein
MTKEKELSRQCTMQRGRTRYTIVQTQCVHNRAGVESTFSVQATGQRSRNLAVGHFTRILNKIVRFGILDDAFTPDATWKAG